jgi:Tripartite tricarboxylate transporter family receptor
LSLGLDLVHVPFNGGAPSVASVVAGHTPIGFTSPTAAVPQIKDGKLRALAVTGKTRSQTLLDVETMAEAGYPDIEGDRLPPLTSEQFGPHAAATGLAPFPRVSRFSLNTISFGPNFRGGAH